MAKLPKLPYDDRITRSVQQNFGGYQHNRGVYDGNLYDMKNLSSDQYPLLGPRRPRVSVDVIAPYNGVAGAEEVLCYAEGTAFYFGTREVGTVSDCRKTFAVLGRRLLIFPDKVYLNTSAAGVYPTAAALTAAVAAPGYGSIYAVGTAAPYDLYVWNGDSWDFLEKEFGTMEPSFQGNVTFCAKGRLFDEDAAENCIYRRNTDWNRYFRPGDAVTIRGCSRHTENNKTAVIREIDGDRLSFYEYAFTLDEGVSYVADTLLEAGSYTFVFEKESYTFHIDVSLPEGTEITYKNGVLSYGGEQGDIAVECNAGIGGTVLNFRNKVFDTEETAVTITREIPNMEHLCSGNNRLWGCAGDTIYCSKQGDPFNFHVFDGLSTDSFSVDSGSPGRFTACCFYLGYPLFFKENQIFKVYGAKPSEFSLVASMSAGVAAGSGKSLAVAGETLFYLSPRGVMAYTGGVPVSLQSSFGELRFSRGIAGSDGRKYYLSVQDEKEDFHLFVYDTEHGLWHREDAVRAVDFFTIRGFLHMAAESGTVYRLRGEFEDGEEAESVYWEGEFGDFIQNSPDKKSVVKLQLRVQLFPGSFLDVAVSYDDGAFQAVSQRLRSSGMRSFYLPVIPRRCDHFRLKLSGEGRCYIHSLAVEYSHDSEI